MNAPAFWFTPPTDPGLRARLLAPLGMVWARVMARRLAARGGWRARVPVICVDTLGPGGHHRAACLQAVVLHLQGLGRRPVILSRNVAATTWGPIAVDLRRHSARDVGPGALLAASMAPTWIARDRAEGARAISAASDGESTPADCIVMEGGFHAVELIRDISIVAVDAQLGFGNGLCMPAGPLREPVTAGLARADLLLSVGGHGAQRRFAQSWGAGIAPPHLRGTLQPLETGMDWAGLRVLALAETGQREAFDATLQRLGACVIRCVALDRHENVLPAALFARLEREAAAHGAQIVVTEPVAVALPQPLRHKVLAVPLRLRIEDIAPLDRALARVGLERAG